MFFRQVLYRDLGCASYVVGDGGEAAVVDPRWDVEIYRQIAGDEGLRITHVLDTHDHADHVSGRARLSGLTGARALRAGSDAEDGLRPGRPVTVGEVEIGVIAVPGHRPESVALVVADHSRGADPWLVLTGDSLLVGDLARPDLLLDAEAGARTMHASLSALLELGDHVEVWPGHVGGSLCGGARLSSKTGSTIGFERLHNPLLMMEREQFVRALTHSLPARPPNVDRIVGLNRSGGREPAEVRAVAPERLRARLEAGATVLDARTPAQFDAGHLAAAINLPVAAAGVGTRAGWLFNPQEPIVVAADTETVAREMILALHAVGLWQVQGYVLGDGPAWKRMRLPVAKAAAWDVERLADALRGETIALLDVRDDDEWWAGHVEGSQHLPLHRMGEIARLPSQDRPTAVACMAGTRAAFAASLLRRAGGTDVVRVAGGGVPDLERYGIRLTVGA